MAPLAATPPQAHDYHFYGTDQGNGYLNVTYELSDTESFTVTMYAASNANSGQYFYIIVPLPDGTWLSIYAGGSSNKFNLGTGNNVEVMDPLTVDLRNYSSSLHTAFAGTFGTVTDSLDLTRFEYLGATADGASSSAGVSGTTLSASAPDANGTMAVSGASSLAVGATGSYSYYVRLKTESSGFEPMTASGGMPVAQTGGEYPLGTLSAGLTVNYSTITYDSSGNGTVSTSTASRPLSITKPSVSGELYYVELEKVSSEDADTKVPGAVYELRQGATVVATLTTRENGTGASAPGVPYGTYSLYETSAPSGYKLGEDENGVALTEKLIGTYSLGYLGDSSQTGVSWTHEQLSDGKLGKLLTGNAAIPNTPAVDLTVRKVVADGTEYGGAALAGARFTLYTDAGLSATYGSGEVTVSSDEASLGTYTWANIPAGTYYLKETGAPAGYQLDSFTYEVKVYATHAEVVATLGEGNGGSDTNHITVRRIDPAATTTASAPSTANTVTVADEPNPSLPETGALGPTAQDAARTGAALMAAGSVAALAALMGRRGPRGAVTGGRRCP